MNSMPRFVGKVALITGGSRGIGAEVARRFGEEGARVAIAFRNDRQSADKLLENLRISGVDAFAFGADISEPEDCEQLVQDCMAVLGRIDIVVNAAGVSAYRTLEKADADHYYEMFNTNVLGALCITRAAALVMENPGRIIHFASRLAEAPMQGTSVYAASKAAVSALVLALSQELGPRGITINAVAPGLIETDMTAKAVQERGDALRAQTPLRRIGQPHDISGLVAFLASDDAGWITGRTIRADGGLL